MTRQTEVGQIAEELCRKYPDQPARSLARMLCERLGSAISIETARSAIRYQLGQTGNVHRKKAKFPRPARKPTSVVEMPISQSKSWEPYHIKCKNLGILSDIHSPYHSEVALGAAIKKLQEEKIDHLLLNGDTLDFYAQSFHERRPSKRNFKAEWRGGQEMLGYLRSQFPNIPITFKVGNHEERWYRWLWSNAPEIAEEPRLSLARWLKLRKHKMQIVEDQRIITAGKLAIAHGHELGKGFTSPVNPARGAFMRTLHTILVGHYHRTSGHCEPNLWHDETFVWSTGCLCSLNPEYWRVDKWNWGFAQVRIDSSNDFEVTNYRISKTGKVRAS